MKTPNKGVWPSISALLLAAPVWAATPSWSIEGVDETLAQQIAERITIDPQAWTPDSSPQQNRQLTAQLNTILQSMGYYNNQIALTPKTEALPKIHVTLGPAIHVRDFQGKVVGVGTQDDALNAHIRAFPLQPGDIFDHAQYEAAKQRMLAIAYFSGYLHADFVQHDVWVDMETHTADIVLTLDTGPRFAFGTLTFHDDYFSPRYLARYLEFAPGDPFSPDALLDLQRHLTLANQFSEVTITQGEPQANHTLPIDINLTRAKPNQYRFGIGYGTDTGARGHVGWDRRWVNRKGHQLKTYGSLSEVYNQGYIEYYIPGYHPINDETVISLKAVEDEYSEQQSRYWEFGWKERKQFENWERTLSLFYHSETFSEFDNSQKQHEKLLLPAIELAKVVQDNPTQPKEGYAIRFKLISSIDTLISDASFAKFTTKLSWLKTLGTHHQLLLQSELGVITPGDISRLPLSIRFYAGGDNLLRGFGYRTLPRNRQSLDRKTSVGGAYLALGRVEWAYRFKSPFGISAFADFGNAFLDRHDPIELGMGPGLRWYTPIGPLKVDFATPLSRSGFHWRLHITFGTVL